MSEKVLPFRILPVVTTLTEFFWTSGRDGRLRFLRCQSCGYYIHPPAPICPRCLGTDVAAEIVSGQGTLHSFTVNHQQWLPGSEPYVIGLVEMAEQAGLRLTTNVVDCASADVKLGMALTVCFEREDDVWLPLFRPC